MCCRFREAGKQRSWEARKARKCKRQKLPSLPALLPNEDKTILVFKKLKNRLFGKKENAETVSETIWDNSAEQYVKDDFKVYWETLHRVALYQFRCMTGDENNDYLTYTVDYLREKVGTENLRGLSIGCGEIAAPEMKLVQTGYFTEFDVMDIAGNLLNRQEKRAQDLGLQGLRYIAQDLNQISLEPDTYDLIWAVGTIHHIEKLESFFDEINKSLKKNGVLVMREYVGPNRLQLTGEQLALVNEILSCLPDKYKRMPDGNIKNTEDRVKVEDLIRVDPSEAVRSEDIMPLLKEKLKIVHLADTGGTILMPFLNRIASNFERDEDGDAILRLVILLERKLIEHGILPSDYNFCLATKKNG